MRKIIIPLALALFSLNAMSQIQRPTPAPKADSSGLPVEPNKTTTKQRANNLAMLKELNLTKAQKQQLKAMRQENKAGREAILNGATLTEAARQQKLKAMKLTAAKTLQGILTDEQKNKLKELRTAKKAAGNMDEVPEL